MSRKYVAIETEVAEHSEYVALADYKLYQYYKHQVAGTALKSAYCAEYMKLDDAIFEILRSIHTTARSESKSTTKLVCVISQSPFIARKAHATQAHASYVSHYGNDYGGGQRAHTRFGDM